MIVQNKFLLNHTINLLKDFENFQASLSSVGK